MSVLRKNAAAGMLALSLIGAFEGLRLHAYADVVGVETICYGETKGVHVGDTATKPECDAKFIARLNEFGDGVEKCLGDSDLALITLPPTTEVAFVSLAYNVGIGAFCKSRVARLWKSEKYAEACDAMAKFNRAGGRALPALTNRRLKERDLCLSGLKGARLS